MNNEPHLEGTLTLESPVSGQVVEPPFQLLVIADLAGDGERGEFGDRRILEIDRDNFDEVLATIRPTAGVEIDGEKQVIDLESLDDFHPDALFQRLPLFGELRDVRKRLKDPDTFRAAMSEMRARTPRAENAAPVDGGISSAVDAPAGLLDSILSSDSGTSRSGRPESDVAALAADLVRPYLVNIDETAQSEAVTAVDTTIGELMRRILHDRRFKALEATWRGLYFLTRRVETSNDLRICVLDMSHAELAGDLKDGSRLAKVLSEGHKGDPFAAVLCDHAFAPDVDDIAALVRVAKLGAAASVPFISHIRPELLGVQALGAEAERDEWDLSEDRDAIKLWNVLRGMPEAVFVAMTLPRFLARMPYGADTDPTEVIEFQEFTGTPETDDYVWTNACYLAGSMLARAFSEFRWHFGGRLSEDIDGLPMHVYRADGQTEATLSAESRLSERDADILSTLGVVPVVPFKDQGRVRLVGFRSIADPSRPLKGRWY